jgi:hypothetical protein
LAGCQGAWKRGLQAEDGKPVSHAVAAALTLTLSGGERGPEAVRLRLERRSLDQVLFEVCKSKSKKTARLRRAVMAMAAII